MRWTVSIEWRWPLLAIALLGAVAGGLTWASYEEVRRLATRAAEERLGRVAALVGGADPSEAGEEASEVEAVAADPAVAAFLRTGSSGDSVSVLRSLETLLDDVDDSEVSVTLWDASGRARLRVGAVGGASWITAPPADGGLAIGPLRALGDSIFYDLTGLVGSGSDTTGRLVERRLVSTSEAEIETLDALLGPETALLVGNLENDLWTDQRVVVPSPPTRVPPGGGPIVYERGGVRRLGISERMPGTPWAILVESSLDSVRAPARAFLGGMSAAAAVALLLAGGATWLLGRRITKPLVGLAAAARDMAEGDYGRRVDVRRGDELGDLGSAFNLMADRVQRRTRDLLRSEDRFRSLVTASAQLVWTTDPEGRMAGEVPMWEEFTGQTAEESRGSGWTAVVHPDDIEDILDRWNEAVHSGRHLEAECRVRRRDGEYRLLDIRAVPIHGDEGSVREWVGAGTDITAEREAERQLETIEAELRQAQRMEAIGRLAGGVAHDFNNLLTAILSPVSMALEDLPDEHAVREDLEDVREAAIRASELTRKLLALSRDTPLTQEILDLNEIVGGMGRMLGRVLGETVELRVAEGPRLGPVRADRSQVEQVILNLAINARDAMPEGGILTIETRNVELDRDYTGRHPSVLPGPYVLLAVSDTGTGIDRETLDHIFEPFFTTKRSGEGTGLGLAMVHGIVHQSGGHVWVYSEPGHGTTFKCYFPVAEVGAGLGMAPEPTPSAPPRGGTETVLLVEDDESVLGVATRGLERMGYTVLSARDGEVAVGIVDSAGGRIDLVVTDVVLPGRSGVEVARAVQERRPGLPVLFLSGYADEAVAAEGVGETGHAFLQKPFTMQGLAGRVRDLLDSRRSRSPDHGLPG